MGKRIVSLAMLLLFSMSLLAACGGQRETEQQTPPAAESGQSAESQDPIKIGAVFILSGISSGYGIAQRAGVELAVADVNEAGGIGGRPLEVIFEDSQGENEKAVTAVQKLIDRDEVVAIIGPTLSSEMFSAGPVAQQSGVPILGVSTTVPGITDIGEYVFRNSLPEAGVLPHTVARSIEKFGLKKVALMWAVDDNVSVAGYEIFKEEFEKQGVEIVAKASFNTKDTEFGPQITRVLAAQPDAIAISSLYQAAALVMVQARQAGYEGPFIGGNGFNSPALIDVGKEAVEGAVVGSPWYPGRDDEKVRKFVEAYTTKMGTGPDQFAAQAYDGLMLIAEAIRAAGSTDRDAVRDALAAIREFEGVTGTFSFDENRNPVMTPFILEIRDGVYTELK